MPVLLKAFAGLNLKLPKYKLILCGTIDDQHKNEILKLAKKLKIDKSMEILGFISDDDKFIELYQNASLFVFPTLYEGFGLPILEAMSSGCIVIASNTSSIPEILPDKQFLFNPNDVKDLLNKMILGLNLNKQEKSSVIKNNHQLFKKFSWTNSAKKLLVYINVTL